MNRLSNTIRKSLIHKSNQDNRQRWSLGELAAMSKLPHLPQTEEEAPVFAPTSSVAETLLMEVNQRLSLQHKKCLDMIQNLTSSSSSSSSPTFSTQSSHHSQYCNKPESTDGPLEEYSSSSSSAASKRVIKAINSPVQQQKIKHHLISSCPSSTSDGTSPSTATAAMASNAGAVCSKRDKQDQIYKKLQHLEHLHADTFAITEQVLSNDKPTLTRFSKADQHLLAATFEQIRSRHASTVENMADIVIDWRSCYQDEIDSSLPWSSSSVTIPTTSHKDHISSLDETLVNQFLKDRLGIQLLCDHYVGIHKHKPGGGISEHCDLEQVVSDAILESHHICDANYGVAPEVHLVEKVDWNQNNKSWGNVGGGVTIVRPWVHHALVELFKNGMASSVQKAVLDHPSTGSRGYCHDDIPPDLFVCLYYNQETEMVICEIMDQGVGLADDEEIQRAFQFATSSSRKRWDRIHEQQSYGMVRSPISSLGVGLPLSRMMMQKFGGDVLLTNRNHAVQINTSVSVQPGCSAYLYLPLRDDIQEIF